MALEGEGIAVDLRVGLVVAAGILEHEGEVRHDVVQAGVGVGPPLLQHLLQVDGLLDDLRQGWEGGEWAAAVLLIVKEIAEGQ